MTDVLAFEGRNSVASSTGQRVVLAAWEHSVAVFDPRTAECSGTIETVFGSGGERLALSDELDSILAADYERKGLVCYSAAPGSERWKRPDLTRIQIITLSRDGLRAFCGREGAPLSVVDMRTGASLEAVGDCRAVHESRFDGFQFHDGPRPRLVEEATANSTSVRRTTFAFLDSIFAPEALIVSESGGPVRCIDIRCGHERWRYDPKPGRHVLKLGYREAGRCVLGVEWPYEKGGAKRLISWALRDGEVQGSAILGTPADCCFALAGELVVAADGSVTSTNEIR